MKDLLQQPPDRGYPAEYLLTRIRGRRSRLISEWRQLVFEGAVQEYLASGRYQGFVRERSADVLWRNLMREYRWVFGQMNEQLREQFRPYFLYGELRTLCLCLRRLRDKNAASSGELLQVSLLSDAIKKVLSGGGELPDAVERLERVLTRSSNRFRGMKDTYERDGLRGTEQQLVLAVLDLIVNARLHPAMRDFFARLIDARNLLSAYKNLRLTQLSAPQFIPGGTLARERLNESLAKGNFEGILSLIRELFRIRIDAPEPTKVEIALYRSITQSLRKAGREPFGAGPILDYLWRCSIEVMNLSVLMNTRELERDLASAELVQ